MGDGVQVALKAARTEMSGSRMKQVCYSVWDWKGSILTHYVLVGSHLLL